MKISGLPIRRLHFIAGTILAAAGLIASWGPFALAEGLDAGPPQLGEEGLDGKRGRTRDERPARTDQGQCRQHDRGDECFHLGRDPLSLPAKCLSRS